MLQKPKLLYFNESRIIIQSLPVQKINLSLQLAQLNLRKIVLL